MGSKTNDSPVKHWMTSKTMDGQYNKWLASKTNEWPVRQWTAILKKDSLKRKDKQNSLEQTEIHRPNNHWKAQQKKGGHQEKIIS